MEGFPIVLLTCVGARSGKLWKSPLVRVEHGGEYLAVASNGGDPKHPVWYDNLLNDPHVEPRDAVTAGDYTARGVTGDEKAVWRDRALAVQPEYGVHQTRTTREIPIFVLTPMKEAG